MVTYRLLHLHSQLKNGVTVLKILVDGFFKRVKKSLGFLKKDLANKNVTVTFATRFKNGV